MILGEPLCAKCSGLLTPTGYCYHCKSTSTQPITYATADLCKISAMAETPEEYQELKRQGYQTIYFVPKGFREHLRKTEEENSRQIELTKVHISSEFDRLNKEDKK